MPRWVHGRQVHGATVRLHEAGPPGLAISPSCDGHVSGAPGVLLTVGLADCVGISLVDPVRRAVALLHSGWRGTAAGILEAGITVLRERLDSHARDLHVHLGPAICGRCYEVGPEVHAALGLPAPRGPQPVDLRAVLAAACFGRWRERTERHDLRALHQVRRVTVLLAPGRPLPAPSIVPGHPMVMPAHGPAPGLCGTCVYARIVLSGKGSKFYLCKKAAVDPSFRKYPPLPVLVCKGHEKGSGEAGAGPATSQG